MIASFKSFILWLSLQQTVLVTFMNFSDRNRARTSQGRVMLPKPWLSALTSCSIESPNVLSSNWQKAHVWGNYHLCLLGRLSPLLPPYGKPSSSRSQQLQIPSTTTETMVPAQSQGRALFFA